jgi:exodeoxyribonuclease V beta subunit
VLVRSNADATSFVAALASAGVPAASSSNDSVLDSAAAAQWRILLSALERPSSALRARAAALTWFVGMSASGLDALDDDGASALVEQLRGWALCVASGGLAALMAEMRAGGLLGRVLGRPGGERDLTDLDHVLELMQGAVGGRPAAASALLAVLDDLTTPGRPGEDDIAPELLSRRIDRDDDTVKVLTVHRAKGLEFPIVLCPTLWRKRPNRQGLPHGQLPEGRFVDTNWMIGDRGKGGKAFTPVLDVDKDERYGEDSRLLYVALTRARHRLVVWWTPCGCTKNVRSPLGEIVHHAGGSLEVEGLAEASGGTVRAVAVHAPAARSTLPGGRWQHGQLEVAVAARELDRSWYQWSFSSIKARMEEVVEEVTAGAVLDLPAVGGVDEPSEVVPPPEVVRPVGATPMPLQSAPAGTAFGTLVHSVMERVDFAAPDVADQLRERVAELLHYRSLPITPDALADSLLVAMATPLGGCMGERRLLDLDRVDRLDELGFDLPLAGLDARAIAGVVAGHLPADDLLRSWFVEAAAGPLAVDVAGLLTGSVDLVARTTDGRYWLADYKTNFLADGDYRPEALAEAMAHHGYPLQATLYLVALHRFLRWRLRGYDPDRHLDGAAYLFLRGMDPTAAGPGAPGIVWWRPPTAAIEELDRLLARGEAA